MKYVPLGRTSSSTQWNKLDRLSHLISWSPADLASLNRNVKTLFPAVYRCSYPVDNSIDRITPQHYNSFTRLNSLHMIYYQTLKHFAYQNDRMSEGVGGERKKWESLSL
jgi:hypothetical protein